MLITSANLQLESGRFSFSLFEAKNGLKLGYEIEK